MQGAWSVAGEDGIQRGHVLQLLDDLLDAEAIDQPVLWYYTPMALAWTPFPALTQIAVFSAAGLVGAYLCAVCLLPALLKGVELRPAQWPLRVAQSLWQLRTALLKRVPSSVLLVGVLLAMSAVGIDLTALSVLGGAVGVALGFGLQKLAANYVSGFVILAERSMRIGDMVRVDGFEGRITDIKARYTVIRALSGRESIVPNELLITSRVENLSLADPKVAQTTQVAVAYNSPVDEVVQLLEAACKAQPRVLAEPAPAACLASFGADGLEFTVTYWIADPENGPLKLKSDINRAILQALQARQIEIPFPQRVVHSVDRR